MQASRVERRFPCARLYPVLLCAILACSVTQAGAAPRDVYLQAVQLAARGHDREAAAMLTGVADSLRGQDVWRERMRMAVALLRMRGEDALRPVWPPGSTSNTLQSGLAEQYIRDHPSPATVRVWIPGLLAALFPGAGHAWLKRWHDAAVAAMLVWPMLLLTFWAWKRRMGPVTVFFSLLTLWLWSGTVFSAVSLAERGSMETYMAWWQGLWQFTGLPGHPW